MNLLICSFKQSVFTFLAELEDLDHIKPLPPVVDKHVMNIASTASMSDESHHNISIQLHSKPPRQNKTSSIYAFTAVVGKKESHALQYVDDAKDVATLLKQLGNNANKA